MKPGNAPNSRSSSELEALLGNALDCALEQDLQDVVEFIVRAIEVHVAATGNEATLDSTYIRAVRSIETCSTDSRPEQADQVRFAPSAVHRRGRAN